MLLVAAGSMAVIYGEGHPFRTRWRIIFIAGVLFIAATGVGAAVGHVALGHVDAGEATGGIGGSGCSQHLWRRLALLFKMHSASPTGWFLYCDGRRWFYYGCSPWLVSAGGRGVDGDRRCGNHLRQ